MFVPICENIPILNITVISLPQYYRVQRLESILYYCYEIVRHVEISLLCGMVVDTG